jgi:cysteinyl-tRNA synthetase
MSKSPILIHNSLTGEFSDISGELSIKFYVCGPTTYSNVHLGHARNYIVHDTIRRILEDYFLIPVIYVINITDIDDKIVKIAIDDFGEATLENCKVISDKYETEFFDLMGKLGVRRPTFLTRVTEYIPEMSSYVQTLLDKKYAYERDGSYWFNSQQYLNDGFSNNPFNLKQIDIQNDSGEQKDFCLLKGKCVDEPHFETDLGKFRPGWHLECSTMATHVLGHVNIHGGGIDLIFPHHTNEILQSCAHSGEHNWCDVFFHCGHLGIDGKKMGKSEKNFTTVKEVLTHIPSQQLRIYFLKGNHNSPMDFSEQELAGLSSTYIKFKTFTNIIKKFGIHIVQTKPSKLDIDSIAFYVNVKSSCDKWFRSNFNTREVINELDQLIDYINQNYQLLNKSVIIDVHKYVMKMFDILGIVFENESTELTDRILHHLLNIRNDIRELACDKSVEIETTKKLFTITDNFRDNILPSLGIILTDK